MEKYRTRGVCASEIQFEVENDIIQQVVFIRGCAGNTLGISALVRGLSIHEAIKKLKGIDCNGRGTSCPDQLAKALEAYINK